jgi:hypothetical protein
MVKFAIFIIPTIHGAKAKFRDTREILDGVGITIKSSLLDGLGENFILGCHHH